MIVTTMTTPVFISSNNDNNSIKYEMPADMTVITSNNNHNTNNDDDSNNNSNDNSNSNNSNDK